MVAARGTAGGANGVGGAIRAGRRSPHHRRPDRRAVRVRESERRPCVCVRERGARYRAPHDRRVSQRYAVPSVAYNVIVVRPLPSTAGDRLHRGAMVRDRPSRFWPLSLGVFFSFFSANAPRSFHKRRRRPPGATATRRTPKVRIFVRLSEVFFSRPFLPMPIDKAYARFFDGLWRGRWFDVAARKPPPPTTTTTAAAAVAAAPSRRRRRPSSVADTAAAAAAAATAPSPPSSPVAAARSGAHRNVSEPRGCPAYHADYSVLAKTRQDNRTPGKQRTCTGFRSAAKMWKFTLFLGNNSRFFNKKKSRTNLPISPLRLREV